MTCLRLEQCLDCNQVICLGDGVFVAFVVVAVPFVSLPQLVTL